MFGGTIKVTPLGLIVSVATVLILFLLYIKSAKPAVDSNQEVSLKDLLVVSLGLVQNAGLEIKKIHGTKQLNEKAKGKTKEGATELLTDADRHSHSIIVGGLEKRFPGLKVISEEHNEISQGLYEDDARKPFDEEVKGLPDVKENIKDLTVWVDPLDATQEFTEDLLVYVTVMICVAVKGKPTIGVIHRPFEKNTDMGLMWGWQGHASSKNLQQQSTSDDTSSKVRRIITSRSHAGSVKKDVEKAFGNDTQVIPAGGAGYKTIQVIQRAADAYVHVTAIKKWDVCAPNAVLNSVEGQMTSLDGSDIDYAATSPEKTGRGIIATMRNHQDYVASLKGLIDAAESKN